MNTTEKQVRYLFSRYDFCLSSVPVLREEIDALEEELKTLEAQDDRSLKGSSSDGMPRGSGTSDPTASNAFGGRDANNLKKIIVEKRTILGGYLGSISTVKLWLNAMTPWQRAAVEAHLIRGLVITETIQFVKAKTKKKYSESGVKKLIRTALDEIVRENS